MSYSPFGITRQRSIKSAKKAHPPLRNAVNQFAKYVPDVAKLRNEAAKQGRRQKELDARAKTNRMHSASVDLAEAQWAARPAGTRSIARPKAGPKANDIGRKSGRGYYHPDRIRERALRRDEQWQRQAIRRRSA